MISDAVQHHLSIFFFSMNNEMCLTKKNKHILKYQSMFKKICCMNLQFIFFHYRHDVTDYDILGAVHISHTS